MPKHSRILSYLGRTPFCGGILELVVFPDPSQNEFLVSYGSLGMHIKVTWCDTCLGTIRAYWGPSEPHWGLSEHIGDHQDTLGTIKATLGTIRAHWGPSGSHQLLQGEPQGLLNPGWNWGRNLSQAFGCAPVICPDPGGQKAPFAQREKKNFCDSKAYLESQAALCWKGRCK